MAKKSYLLLAFFGICALALLGHAQQLPDAPPAQLRTTLEHPLAEVTAIQPSVSPTLYLLAPAVEQAPRGRVLDSKFIALGVLAFAATAADIELTQHCLREKSCVELNPTLPPSRWGMYAVNTPVNLALMYLSYRRKSAGKWSWWIAPVGIAGAHGVGLASNIRFALR